MTTELARYDPDKHPKPKLAPAQSELEYLAIQAVDGPLVVTLKNGETIRARLYIELL